MAGLTLNAEVRTKTGQGPSRRDRVSGQVPAVVYGRGVEQPVHCTLNRREFEAIIAKAQRNTIYKLAFAGKAQEREVIVREIQRHPITRLFSHVDFQAIDMTHPIKIDVDLKFVGDPVGKKSGAIFTTQLKTVRIECLPTKIPTELTLDISPLDVGDSFHVVDLPKGDYKILTSPKFTVCQMSIVKEEVEATPAAAAAEGAAPAEGAAAPAAGAAPAGAAPAAAAAAAPAKKEGK